MLRQYRHAWVLPAFTAMDERAFRSAADASSWPYDLLQPQVGGLPDTLLTADWCHETWKWYPCWAVIKVLGRWPLEVFGRGELPATLPRCPLCSH
eukprot:9562066-Karenia_brevis.AAC.1